MIEKRYIVAMRAAICAVVLAAGAWVSLGAEAVNLVVRAVDFGLVPTANVLYTLTPTGPLRRTYGTNVVVLATRSVRSDANGVAVFSTTLWGTYNLDIPGNAPTSWKLWVTTNYSGNVSAALFVTNSSAMPPNPTANYYTMGQVDALLESAISSSTNTAGFVHNSDTGVTLGGAFTGTFTGSGAGLTNVAGANAITNNQTGVTLAGNFSGNLFGNASSAASANQAVTSATVYPGVTNQWMVDATNAANGVGTVVSNGVVAYVNATSNLLTIQATNIADAAMAGLSNSLVILVNSNTTGVLSVNSRTGMVTIIKGDVTGALGYPPQPASLTLSNLAVTGAVTNGQTNVTLSGAFTGDLTGTASGNLTSASTLDPSKIGIGTADIDIQGNAVTASTATIALTANSLVPNQDLNMNGFSVNNVNGFAATGTITAPLISFTPWNTVSIGNAASSGAGSMAIGVTAKSSNGSISFGYGGTSSDYGIDIGYGSKATNYGVAIGRSVVAPGLGDVAIGSSASAAAAVPNGWTNTTELGPGTATLPSGLNFLGKGIVDSNGVVVASGISTTGTVAAARFTGDGGGLTNIAVAGSGINGGLASFQARTNAAAVLQLADVTGVGGAPTSNPTLFNPTLYDSSGNPMVTFSGDYLTHIVNPQASGNAGNLLRNTNLYLEVSTIGGEVKAGAMSEFTLANAGGGANVTYAYPGNSYGTMISPMFAGSGAGLTDARPYGPEIWLNQPLPVILWTFYSVKNVTLTKQWWPGEANAKAVALMLNTNHIFTTTNYGIRNPIVLNGFWISTNRAADGTLMYASTNYPNGLTNTVDYVRRQGSEVWVDMMYSARTPVAPNTEMIVDVGTGDWRGDGIGAFATTHAADQPAMTANSVKADIKQLYLWGIEGVIVLDQGDPVSGPANSVGYRNMMQQQVAHAVTYAPADVAHGTGEYYSWWNQAAVETYPDRFRARHNMSITMWQPHALHDPTIAYGCNNMGFDTGSDYQSVPGHDIYGTSFALEQVYYPVSWVTNFPAWSTHFVMQQMEWEGNDFNSWTTNDWQAVFGMQAVWHSTLQLSYPFDYTTNGWFQATITNAAFLTVLGDQGQHAPHCASFGTNDSIFWNHLSSQPDARVALFTNTKTNANTSTNLVVTWTQLGINTNLVCDAVDVWSGADLGNWTNSISLTVSNNSTRFFTLTPVRFQMASGGGGDVTLAMLQSATNTSTLVDQGLLGTGSGLDGTHIAPSSVNTNVFDSGSWYWMTHLPYDPSGAATAATNGFPWTNVPVARATSAVRATNFVGQLSPTNWNNGTGASASTYAKGDGTWGTPGGSGDVLAAGNNNFTGTNTFNGPTAFNGTVNGTNTATTFYSDVVLNDATNRIYFGGLGGSYIYGIGGTFFSSGPMSTPGTFTAGGVISGNGSGLTNLPGSSVNNAVPQASNVVANADGEFVFTMPVVNTNTTTGSYAKYNASSEICSNFVTGSYFKGTNGSATWVNGANGNSVAITNGTVTASGTVTGGSFSGAGTGLTGTAASLSIGGNAATATSATTAGSATTAATATDLTSGRTNAFGKVRIGGAAETGDALNVTGNIHSSAGVTAANIGATSDVNAGSGGQIYWDTRTIMKCATNGDVQLVNYASTAFNKVIFGKLTADWPAIKVEASTNNVGLSVVTGGTNTQYAGFTAGSYATATNSWALNTTLAWGTNALVLTSGAATGGIIGISGFPTSTEGNLGLLVKATGDIVFTNASGFVCSDFLSSRTITNGNFARIGVTLTPGVCTNIDIVQYR